MRTSFAVWTLLTAALCCAHAQDQEKKLVDRLLKPDMTLQNDAQNKKFVGDGSASINKRANVGTFFVHRKPHSKNFGGTRDFSKRNFILRPITAKAVLTTFHRNKRSRIPRPPTPIRPPAVFMMHLSPGKRLPLGLMEVTGRFWIRARIRSHSTEKMSRSRSSRCASC